MNHCDQKTNNCQETMGYCKHNIYTSPWKQSTPIDQSINHLTSQKQDTLLPGWTNQRGAHRSAYFIECSWCMNQQPPTTDGQELLAAAGWGSNPIIPTRARIIARPEESRTTSRWLDVGIKEKKCTPALRRRWQNRSAFFCFVFSVPPAGFSSECACVPALGGIFFPPPRLIWWRLRLALALALLAAIAMTESWEDLFYYLNLLGFVVVCYLYLLLLCFFLIQRFLLWCWLGRIFYS